MAKEMITRLRQTGELSPEDFSYLLQEAGEEDARDLFAQAREVTESIYGKKIYIRGLIEFTNHCRNDCYYCGLRRGNTMVSRYRLSEEEILSCCREGYSLGFRTFVLQGGEDPYFTDEKMCHLIRAIKSQYPDCALTLSLGEKEMASYQAYRNAGADRYLLRHETANEQHYAQLHPEELSLEHRKQCLRNLKQLGFQTGCGFMVGSPGQTVETLYEDLTFIRELQPEMIGIGPFIPQKDTPLGEKPTGSLEWTRRLLAILRLREPHALLPSTTALATIHPRGREWGILAGANVIMPNLSPACVREKYQIYDHKATTGAEAAEAVRLLKEQMAALGYEVVIDRGDYSRKSE